MNTTDTNTKTPIVDDRSVELMAKWAKALVVAVDVVVVATFIMLSLGFVLLLAGASPDASFVDWVYRNTERAMGPFRGMFPIEEFDGRSVFDPSLLFAAAFYGFVALGLGALVSYLSGLARAHHRPPPPAISTTGIEGRRDEVPIRSDMPLSAVTVKHDSDV